MGVGNPILQDSGQCWRWVRSGSQTGRGREGRPRDPENLPLRLTIVVSAYNIALRMIRFSDDNASLVFLFLGILLSIFGIRGDRAQFSALFLLFLASMIVMTIAP